jgi:NTE family protein
MKVLTDNPYSWRERFERARQLNLLPELLRKMPDEVFDCIEPHLEWCEIEAGEYLFRQDDVGDALYIVLNGRLKAFIQNKRGEQRILGEIGRGETVGEMAILTGELRSADIVAVRDSVLARLSKESFEHVARQFPMIVLSITRLIIERLRQRNVEINSPYKVVSLAVVPITEGLDLTDFCQKLYRELSKKGKTLHLSSRRVDEMINISGISQVKKGEVSYPRLAQWLDIREAEHDFVIFQSDTDVSQWTRRALTHADDILLVGDATQSSQLSVVEQFLASDEATEIANRTLILLQNDGTYIPTNTRSWLDKRDVHWHHHLRRNTEGDFARLARFLSGEATGLVLSGGGARAVAHIGVIRALEESGIHYDIVGGTSMGSIIAGCVAQGLDAKNVQAVCRKGILSNPTGDFNWFPIASLFKGKRVDAMLKNTFGHYDIVDSWFNFYCVSSNLTQARAEIHRKGALHQAIRASISLPGVFPPVIRGNDFLIDGGIFNNLPVDVMWQMGINHIIAADLKSEKPQTLDFDIIPDSWTLFKERFRKPEARRFHNIPNTLTAIIQSTTLSSDFKTNEFRQKVDLLFNPNVEQFGLVQWDAFDKIVEVGYQHARQLLDNQ